jgi:hypothetical protein
MTRYVPYTLEVIHSGNIHHLSINTSPDEEDIFVMWLMRGFKKDVTRKKSWVHPFFNKSGQLGISVVPKELD